MQFINNVLQKRFLVKNTLSSQIGRLFCSMARVVKSSRVLIHAKGKTRRFYIVHFNKKYVQNQLKMRMGNCRQCGACCNMLFTCPLLSTDRACAAYGTCRPESCRIFPIDQRDIDEVRLCGNACGYSFKSEEV